MGVCGCGTGHSPIRHWVTLTGEQKNRRITVKMAVRRWTNTANGLTVTVQTGGVLFAGVSGHMLGSESI